jgi:hypothetical protein
MKKAFTKAKPQAWIDEAAKNPSKYMSAQLEKMKQGTLRWGQTRTLRWGQTLFSVYSQLVAW